MLGLRKYGGVQVDLFWGSYARFEADVFIGLTTGEPLSVSGAILLESWEELLKLAVEPDQHAVIVVTKGDQTQVIACVKTWLEGGCSLRRITLITEDLELHDDHQAELFRQFPDEA